MHWIKPGSRNNVDIVVDEMRKRIILHKGVAGPIVPAPQRITNPLKYNYKNTANNRQIATPGHGCEQVHHALGQRDSECSRQRERLLSSILDRH